MRFSIRDVLWLTVVVALAVGWWLSVPPASGRAAGTITVAGKPLTQGQVIFYSLDHGAIVGAKVAAGKYQIPSIPPGRFAITVDGPGVQCRLLGPEAHLP